MRQESIAICAMFAATMLSAASLYLSAHRGSMVYGTWYTDILPLRLVAGATVFVCVAVAAMLIQ